MSDEPSSKPVHAGKRWTKDDDARLVAALRELQGTFSARFHMIAEMLGRTKGSVESRAGLLDLLDYGRYNAYLNASSEGLEADLPHKGEAWTEPDIAKLLIAHEIGDDMVSLASALGRTPRACALKLVHLGKVTPTLKSNPQPTVTYKELKPKVSAKVVAPSPAGSQKITITPKPSRKIF